MNPEDEKVPEEQWQQPSISSAQVPYQAVPEADVQTELEDDAAEEAPDAQTDGVETEVVTGSQSDDTALVRWQSTEYLHQERTAFWYLMLAVVTVVLMLLAYIVIKSLTFTILLPVMAVTLVMYVRRPPAPNDYSVSRKGVHINDKLYAYDQFRSFGVVEHQGHHSVVLVPRKRFQLGQTIYFPEEIGETLVDMLAARLPMKETAPDLIDRILARLHL
jgi:hypothetical protein